MLKVFVSVFMRTFAALALAVFLGAQTMDWVNGDKRVNISIIGVGLFVAAIGALVAGLWAAGGTPAVTRLEKATRSAIQALAGGLSGLVFNSVADIMAMSTLLVPLAIAVALAFLVTYLQYQAPLGTVVEVAATETVPVHG